MSERKKELFARLRELTKDWNQHDDVPRDQQAECAAIGAKLNAMGGIPLMQEAYYDAKRRNRYAGVLGGYWNGIGNWMW